MSDEFKVCPHCAEQVQREALICRFCDRGISATHFKKCPSCAELIWTKASLCRYCKSELPKWTARDSQQLRQELVAAGWTPTVDDAEIDRIFENMMMKKRKK